MMDIAIMIDTFNFQTVAEVITDANPGSLATASFPCAFMLIGDYCIWDCYVRHKISQE